MLLPKLGLYLDEDTVRNAVGAIEIGITVTHAIYDVVKRSLATAGAYSWLELVGTRV